MFIKMENLKVLVVGGGHIAAEKLEKMLDFTQDITIIALGVEEGSKKLIEEHTLTLYPRAYEVGDMLGFDIVIVATDTVELHKNIYEESRGSGVLKFC